MVASGGSGVEREEAIMALTHWDLLSPGVIFLFSSLLLNSLHHQFTSNRTSHKVSNFIPRGENPLVCFVGFRPVCKGPWGGVKKEGDTRLEELTI